MATTTSPPFRASTCSPTAIQGSFPDITGTYFFCNINTFGNQTTILKSCCTGTNDSISFTPDGCNVICSNSNSASNKNTKACLDKNALQSICGSSVPSTVTSFTSSTATATGSAASTSTTGAAEPLAKGKGVVLLGMMALVNVLLSTVY